jgi:hypothetical protein
MTDNEIRIAVAEACGLTKHIPNWIGTGNRDDAPRCYCQCGFTAETDRERCEHENKFYPPDYLNDLNAMNRAEESLRGETWAQYFDLIQRSGSATGVRATARQRAEAFLRTLNKWKD